jgi:hypothetical protein
MWGRRLLPLGRRLLPLGHNDSPVWPHIWRMSSNMRAFTTTITSGHQVLRIQEAPKKKVLLVDYYYCRKHNITPNLTSRCNPKSNFHLHTSGFEPRTFLRSHGPRQELVKPAATNIWYAFSLPYFENLLVPVESFGYYFKPVDFDVFAHGLVGSSLERGFFVSSPYSQCVPIKFPWGLQRHSQ